MLVDLVVIRKHGDVLVLVLLSLAWWAVVYRLFARHEPWWAWITALFALQWTLFTVAAAMQPIPNHGATDG